MASTVSYASTGVEDVNFCMLTKLDSITDIHMRLEEGDLTDQEPELEQQTEPPNLTSGKSVTIGGADDVNFLRCELVREVFLRIHTSIC